MSRIEHLREQIDACRPGSDDLALPGLAELARAAEEDRAVADELARCEQSDRAVASALHDVEIPSGLVDRVLAAVRHQAVERPVTQQGNSLVTEQALAAAADYRPAEAAVSPRELAGDSERPPRRYSRRFWMRAGVVAGSLSLVSLAAIYFWPRPQQRVPGHELAAAVGSWAKTVGTPPDGWTTTKPLPVGFLLDQDVQGQPIAWRRFTTAQGWQSVAVDYTLSGRQATLFIVRSPARFEVQTLPFTRLPSSGQSMAAWQKGNLLYVLVVGENGQRLEDFIHPKHIT